MGGPMFVSLQQVRRDLNNVGIHLELTPLAQVYSGRWLGVFMLISHTPPNVLPYM